MHSANGVEQQHAAGNEVVTAEALVDAMAPQTLSAVELNGNGAAAYVNGNGNGNGAESGTVKVPPEELIRAAQGLRQRVSALRQ